MADKPLSVLVLSAYHGGPREAFVESLAAHSRHEVSQITLPPRTWPWRLRGSALWFAREIDRLRRRIDLVLASDLVDVARLRALLPARLRNVPVVQYFHTDVLSGDLKNNPRDEPLAAAQFYSILAADRVLAASEHHRAAIVAGAKRLIGMFPDAVPVGLLERIEKTVGVQPPGVDAEAIRAASPRSMPPGPPVVLWNHPWTDDQNPRMFFEALDHLKEDGVAFRLVAVGIAVRKYPEVFAAAHRRLADRIVQFGYVPGREAYLANIRTADVVVSCARREWFPLATVEAVIAGATPLVGRSLANPEVFGDRLADCSYRGPVDLRRRLARLLAAPHGAPRDASPADALAARYAWPRIAAELDEVFSRTAAGSP